MIGRKKSPQNDETFRASIKSYYEEQLRRKRLSNESQSSSGNIVNDGDLDSSVSRLELCEIEHSTVHNLLSRLSLHKTQHTPNGSSSSTQSCSISSQISPNKSSLMPMQSIAKPATNAPNFQMRQQLISQPLFNGTKPGSPSISTPSTINVQKKPLTPSPFTSQQNPLSQLHQTSPINAQFRPTSTVLPQSSTPLQKSPVFQPKIAYIEPVQQQKTDNKKRLIDNFGLGNLSMRSNLTPNSSTNLSLIGSTNLTPIMTTASKPIIQPSISAIQPIVSTPQISANKLLTDSTSQSSTNNLPTASATSTPSEQQPTPTRQRRPSKSETPETSKFSHWVKTTLQNFEEYMLKLRDFKSNKAVLPLCNNVRMGIQEVIDVHTSDDANDIKSISGALIFFQDLYQTGAIKKGVQPLPLTPSGKLFITMCICDRYLKRVVGQDGCTSFVATLFLVLAKNEPELFSVLVSMVFSKCVLPRLDTVQCLERVLELSKGPAEVSAQWLSEEQARFKLLIKMCALTTTKSQDGMQGQELIHFLLTEALRAPAIPISTPFVINSILSTDITYYQKRQSAEFADLVCKSKAICDLDWPVIIRRTVDAVNSEIQFTDRAFTLMTTKNAVLLQNLKTTVASIRI